MTEFRLFDAPGAEVAEIVTDGSTFKPLVNVLESVADEIKLQVTDYGLEVQVVDAANVFMADVFLAADAFTEYEVAQETRLGVTVPELKKLIRRARKGKDDELTVSIQDRELSATVSRGYENHNVVSRGTMQLLDPDSVRGEPDLPDLDHDVHTRVDTRPLIDALSYGVSASDHVEIAVKGVNQHTNALYIGAETGMRSESVAIDNIDTDGTAGSKYSKDYVTQILRGIKETEPESVSLSLNDEYPLLLEMESSVTPMQVRYLLAPRVSK